MNPTAIRANFPKYLYLLALAAVFVFATGNISAQDVYTTDTGEKFSVNLHPARERILLGEPTSLIFEIRNLSDTKLSLWIDLQSSAEVAGYSITVTQPDGTLVPQAGLRFFTGKGERETSLEPGEMYRRTFNLPGEVSVISPGLHKMTVEKALRIGTAGSMTKETISVAAVASLEVLPADPEQLGTIIAELETQLLYGDSANSKAAASRLIAFRDPRARTAFRRFLEMCGTRATVGGEIPKELEGTARNSLFSLVYSNDTETGALVRELRNNPSNYIRTGLTEFLSRGFHADKFLLLAEMSRDPLPSIRSEVANVLAEDSTPETERTLIELLNDENQGVRTAARQSLDARKAKPSK